ncbi:MAG: hypothetical protein HFI85_01450 [Clostridia bacterium]|jgi:stage III sporulation protein AF|nr:hypothetical protein [Clostridia bacterium]
MLTTLSGWILSIAGVICISVIVELVMPDGQMNSYIKKILSFIIVLVIILPLPKLLKTEIDLNNIFDYSENIEVDKDYLYQLNLNKINIAKDDIETKIKSHGYNNVFVYVNADIFQNNMRFKSITVDLSGLVISGNSEHNDITKIKKDISKIITEYVTIDEEAIIYDE